MPIVPASKTSIKTLAALLLPSWLRLQSNPTGSIDTVKAGLAELEKALKE